jgi:hypothetical protein
MSPCWAAPVSTPWLAWLSRREIADHGEALNFAESDAVDA